MKHSGSSKQNHYMTTYLYIETPEQLLDLCERLRGSPWLALDTEFMREKTYYAQLCLIQVANSQYAACVDPLRVSDLGPLLDLIYDPTIVKVMHSGRQDLELLYDLRKELPHPLFDTQVAARLIGQGEHVGYGNLLESMLGVRLEKAHTRTDWARRPLSEDQLHYAADDVRYLGEIYLTQRDTLAREGRLQWVEDEFRKLTDIKNYVPSPQDAWQRIRGSRHLKSAAQLNVLKALAAWREEYAIKSNRPRNWILHDDVLLQLSRQMPDNLEDLEQVRGIEPGFLRRHGQDLLVMIRAAKSAPGTAPVPEERPARLNDSQEAIVDLLMAVVRLRAAQNEVSPASLTTRKDLEKLILGERDVSVLEGWRRPMAGEDLLAVLKGERSIMVREGSLVLESR